MKTFDESATHAFPLYDPAPSCFILYLKCIVNWETLFVLSSVLNCDDDYVNWTSLYLNTLQVHLLLLYFILKQM